MTLGLNARAALIADSVCENAESLRIVVSRGDAGERLIDAGAATVGGIEVGLRLAEMCMGGLGAIMLGTDPTFPHWPLTVTTRSSQPVAACLASQYAGWSLSHGEGKGAFFALGSGPARALAHKEKLFADLDVSETSDRAVLVLESGRAPPRAVVEQVAQACGIAADSLTVAFAPTQSLAGSVQVVARVLEVAMHKAHELHFPLARIVDGVGSAPLPPPHPDFVTAMGRTNDAIIFGGRVHLFVAGDAKDARELAQAMPANMSRDYGRPFAETFAAVKGDFYKIDPMLFSPAEIIITCIDNGETFRGGKVDAALLDASFGG